MYMRDVRRTRGEDRFLGGQEKELMRCLLDDLRAFGIKADKWTIAAQDTNEWYQTANKGAEIFTKNWFVADGARTALRHAVVPPNVTGKTKERVAQSKRACTDLLDTIDES